MKLRRLAKDRPAVSLRLKVPGEVYEALTAYAEYYAHQHGDAIEIPDLLIEIVRTFVAVDRAFRGWQRGAREAATSGAGKGDEAEGGAR